MTTLGGYFREPIVEDRPSATNAFAIAFDHFEDHFWEPMVEDRPLATNPFGMAFEHFGGGFGQPILEDRPLGTNPFGIPLAKASRKTVPEARFPRGKNLPHPSRHPPGP